MTSFPTDDKMGPRYHDNIRSLQKMVIKDTDFEKIADNVKPDAKRRVVLKNTTIQEGISYHIYTNRMGQIILDPQVTIPASELWLFNNPEALASVKRGLDDAAQGRVSKVNPDTL